MLKLALIENLRRLAEETLEGRAARLAADRYLDQIAGRRRRRRRCPRARSRRPSWSACCSGCASTAPWCRPVRADVEARLTAQGMTAEDVIRTEHQAQATAQVSVGNAITSLRLCSTLDWTLLLRERQPGRAGAAAGSRRGRTASMDFQSRDRYRQAVEELAEPSGEAQLRVALRSVESARQAAERTSADDRAAHVGYHLIGTGPARPRDRRLLPARRCAARARRFVSAHATAVYLGLHRARHRHRCWSSPPPTRACRAATPGQSCSRRLLLLLPGHRTRHRAGPARWRRTLSRRGACRGSSSWTGCRRSAGPWWSSRRC